MRIVKRARLVEFWSTYPDSKTSLERWYQLTKKAKWQTFVLLKESWPSADLATVKSGKKVVVFDIAGNKYRLIGAVHFITHIVFVKKTMTHKEYEKGDWKKLL